MGLNIHACKPDWDIINSSDDNVNVAVLGWNHDWIIVLYFVELVTLLAVVLCLGYLMKNRNSPLVKLCFSFPDNIILTILALFCLLPLAHIGGISAQRCFILWPMVNVLYAFYAALLMTKTIFLQNILECKAPTDNPGRRAAFGVLMAVLHLIILATLSLSRIPTVKHFACPTRGIIAVCDIRGNISIIFSTTFNWFVIFFLFILTLVEAVNNRKDFRRAKNQIGVSLVAILSYSCLIIYVHFTLHLQHHTLITYLFYVVLLINPVVSLVTYYLPTIYRIFTCLRHQEKISKVTEDMSPSGLQSSTNDVLFNYSLRTSFDPGHIPSWCRASEASSISYPTSLVGPDGGEFIRVLSPTLRASMVEYRTYLAAANRLSFYGNVLSLEIPTSEEEFSEDNADIGFTPEQLKQMMSYIQGLDSTDV